MSSQAVLRQRTARESPEILFFLILPLKSLLRWLNVCTWDQRPFTNDDEALHECNNHDNAQRHSGLSMIACSIAPTWDSLLTGRNAHAREQKGIVISWILSSGDQVDSTTLWKVALDASFTFDVKRPAAQIHAVHHIRSLPCVISHNQYTFPPRPERTTARARTVVRSEKLPISNLHICDRIETPPPPQHLGDHISGKPDRTGLKGIGRAAMQRYAMCMQSEVTQTGVQ